MSLLTSPNVCVRLSTRRIKNLRRQDRVQADGLPLWQEGGRVLHVCLRLTHIKVGLSMETGVWLSIVVLIRPGYIKHVAIQIAASRNLSSVQPEINIPLNLTFLLLRLKC